MDHCCHRIINPLTYIFIMESFTVYKDRALASLKGNWDKGVIATVIYLAIAAVGSNIFSTLLKPEVGGILSLVWFLACLPLVWGFYVYFLRLFVHGSSDRHRDAADPI